MEQKPIKRSASIVQLSKDHHFTLLFCWKIRQGLKQGIDPERIKNYVQHFWQDHMQAHFREEEEMLFAPVADDKVQKAVDEHRQISEQVNVVRASNGEAAAETLARLADLVDAHVRYEERELFPHLERALTPQQLEDIGRRLQQEPVLADDFEDEFWTKKK